MCETQLEQADALVARSGALYEGTCSGYRTKVRRDLLGLVFRLYNYIHPGSGGIRLLSDDDLGCAFWLAHTHAREMFLEATTVVGDLFLVFQSTPGLRAELSNL